MPLRSENCDLCSFVLGLSADQYGAKELAVNAITNAQVWYRRLGHLHAQSLDIIRKRDGTDITFEGAVLDCDVCAVGKAQQLAHLNIANHNVNRPFQLSYGGLTGPFTPVAIAKYVGKITNEYTKWTVVYLWTSNNQALQSLQLFVGSTFIPFGGSIVRWHADKGGEYTGEELRQYCLETGIIQEFTTTNTPQQVSVSERVGRTLYTMVRYVLVDSWFPSSVAVHGGRVPLEQDSAQGAQDGDVIQNTSRRGNRSFAPLCHRSQNIGAHQGFQKA